MASVAFDPFANDDDDDDDDDYYGDNYDYDDDVDDDDDDDIFLPHDQSHLPLPTTTDDSLLRHSATSSSTNTATASSLSSRSSRSRRSQHPRDYYAPQQQWVRQVRQVSPQRSSPLRSSPRRRNNNNRSNSSQFSNDANSSSYYSNNRNNTNARQNNIQEVDIIKEFDTAFPSMTLNDSVTTTTTATTTTTDQFGFPSSDVFPATFEQLTSGVVAEDTTNNNNSITNSITNSTTLPLQSSSSDQPTISNLEGVTFVIAEEMSVIHKSHTNQCSVKVHGTISIQSSYHPARIVQCNISILDPGHHLQTTSSSKSYDYVRPIILSSESNNEILTENPIHHKHATNVNNYNEEDDDNVDTATAFCISMPELNGQDVNNDNWSDEGIGGSSCSSYSYPLVEYTCGEKLRPVPMLINTNIHEYDNNNNNNNGMSSSRITLQLRVNPRNKFPLANAVALLSVPDEYDGQNARVSRSIDNNNNRLQTTIPNNTKEANGIVTNWSEITRILSWRVGGLHSGMICQYEALFPPCNINNNNNNVEQPVSNELHHDGKTMDGAKFPVLLRYDSEGGLLSNVDLDFDGGRKHTPTVKRKFRVYHREV